MDEFVCPKCKGKMEEGWLPDDLFGSTQPMRWVKGRPVRNQPASKFIRDAGYKEPEPDRMVPIVAYACTTCGFMEFYARRPRAS